MRYSTGLAACIALTVLTACGGSETKALSGRFLASCKKDYKSQSKCECLYKTLEGTLSSRQYAQVVDIYETAEGSLKRTAGQMDHGLAKMIFLRTVSKCK